MFSIYGWGKKREEKLYLIIRYHCLRQQNMLFHSYGIRRFFGHTTHANFFINSNGNSAKMVRRLSFVFCVNRNCWHKNFPRNVSVLRLMNHLNLLLHVLCVHALVLRGKKSSENCSCVNVVCSLFGMKISWRRIFVVQMLANSTFWVGNISGCGSLHNIRNRIDCLNFN